MTRISAQMTFVGASGRLYDPLLIYHRQQALCKVSVPQPYAFLVPYSEAERMRRSELAKRLHREGKLGGPGPARRSVEARRAKSQRISEAMQEMAVKHVRDIENALTDAMRHGTPGQKIRAAEAMTKLALASERLDGAERKVEAEHLDREALIGVLVAKLTTGPVAGLLRARLAEGSIDSTAEVIEQP